MTMFTYNAGVPFATNNPSNDQPQMLINTVSINGIWNIDHVGFNSTGVIGNPQASGGQHLQVTFNGKNVPIVGPTDPLSVLYTKSGTASSISEMLYRNQNGIFQVSPIKAWGYIGGSTLVPNGGQAVNVGPITHPSTGIYAISLTTNSVSGVNFGVLVSADSGTPSLAGKYHVTGPAAFQLQFFDTTTNTLTDPNNFSFIVLQI